MTSRTREGLKLGLLVAILPSIIGAVAAMSTTQVRLGNVAEALDSLSVKLSRVDARVAEIYCASVPVTQRAGCR